MITRVNKFIHSPQIMYDNFGKRLLIDILDLYY